MMEDELYMLAGTAESHANEVRQTHSIFSSFSTPMPNYIL